MSSPKSSSATRQELEREHVEIKQLVEQMGVATDDGQEEADALETAAPARIQFQAPSSQQEVKHILRQLSQLQRQEIALKEQLSTGLFQPSINARKPAEKQKQREEDWSQRLYVEETRRRKEFRNVKEAEKEWLQTQADKQELDDLRAHNVHSKTKFSSEAFLKLYSDFRGKKKELQKKQQLKNEVILSSCTFKPQIITKHSTREEAAWLALYKKAQQKTEQQAAAAAAAALPPPPVTTSELRPNKNPSGRTSAVFQKLYSNAMQRRTRLPEEEAPMRLMRTCSAPERSFERRRSSLPGGTRSLSAGKRTKSSLVVVQEAPEMVLHEPRASTKSADAAVPPSGRPTQAPAPAPAAPAASAPRADSPFGQEMPSPTGSSRAASARREATATEPSSAGRESSASTSPRQRASEPAPAVAETKPQPEPSLLEVIKAKVADALGNDEDEADAAAANRLAQEEADRKVNEEVERRAKERKAKEEADHKAKDDAAKWAHDEAVAKEEASRKAKEEADRRAAEADKKAKEEAERREADRKAKEEADKKAKDEADRKAKEVADKKAKDEADRKAKEVADRKAKEDADRRVKEEADRKAKDAADKKAKDEADRKAKQENERKASEEAQRKAKEVLRRTQEEVAAPPAKGPKPFLGMTLTEREGTVVVGAIFVLGPAHRCGIIVEDVVVTVAWQPVKCIGDVRDVVEAKGIAVGQLVPITVLQNQGTLRRDVVLRVMTTDPSVAEATPDLFYNLEGHKKVTAGAAAPAAGLPDARKAPPVAPGATRAKSTVDMTKHRAAPEPPRTKTAAEAPVMPSPAPGKRVAPTAHAEAAPVQTQAPAAAAAPAPAPAAAPAPAPAPAPVPSPRRFAPKVARNSDSDSDEEPSISAPLPEVLEIQQLQSKKSNRELAKERMQALLVDDD